MANSTRAPGERFGDASLSVSMHGTRHTGRDAIIAALAGRQHGVVARRQLIAAGLTKRVIDAALAAGRLHLLHRGVYAVGHAVLTRQARWMAAVLACGDRAVLSHADAAALLGLRPSTAARIHVTVPSTAGRLRAGVLVVHRSSTLTTDDTTLVDGIPVTGVGRTLIDLAEVVAPRSLERAMEEAEVLRVDWAQVVAALDRHPGRRGAARVRARLAAGTLGTTLTRSELEDRVLELCDAHGLPRPAVNARVAGLEVDFWWPAHRLALEADSRRFHDTATAFERDRARDERLVREGIRVIRVTHRRLATDPAGLAGTLRQVLGDAAVAGERTAQPPATAPPRR